MWRWAFALTLCIGCGPAVGTPTSDESSGGATTAAESTSSGGTSTSAGTEPTTASTAAASGSSSESSGGVVYDPDQALGVWLCEGGPEPFAIHVDAYDPGTGAPLAEGRACASWNDAPAPRDWEPCGELTLHPIGSWPVFALYVQISSDRGSWLINGILQWDPANDTLRGSLMGEAGASKGDVTCARVEA